MLVVDFNALAQASDFLIERRQVVFLCCVGFEAGKSETPNRQQTECPLTNRIEDQAKTWTQQPVPMMNKH